MSTESDIQAYLDSLSQLPGSVLYRDSISWKALAPGASGQCLSLTQNLLPYWRAISNYYPAMMDFANGPSYHFSNSLQVSNTKFTSTFRVCMNAPGQNAGLTRISANNKVWMQQIIRSSGKVLLAVYDYTQAVLFLAQSLNSVCDNLPHYCFWQFDPADGGFEFVIDGQDANDPSYGGFTAISGTLGVSSSAYIRYNQTSPSLTSFNGRLGCAGFHLVGSPVWSDFMTAEGHPLQLDEATWSQWGSRPQIWNVNGELSNNKGTKGNMTVNGTFKVADPQFWG